jgi:anti-anti-sigma regulatory factor
VDDIRTISLDGDLTIANAGTIRERLLEGFSGTGDVRLLFAETAGADLSCIQLLCSAHRTFLAASKRLVSGGPIPDAVKKVLEEAGFYAGFCGSGDPGCLWREEAN